MKKKEIAKKIKNTPKKSFIERLEEHKRVGASFDNGTWKPSKKGESFIQAIEKHKSSNIY